MGALLAGGWRKELFTSGKMAGYNMKDDGGGWGATARRIMYH